MTQSGNGGNRPKNGHGNSSNQSRNNSYQQNQSNYANQQNHNHAGFNSHPRNNSSNNFNNRHTAPARSSPPASYDAVANLGLLFNKLLYLDETPTDNLELKYGIRENASGSQIDKKLNALYVKSKSQMHENQKLLSFPEELGADVLRLKTIYPGMYIGLGYSHGVPNNSDDIKNGFSFDYTSGLPVLPASSVKGCLRSGLTEKKEDALFLLQQLPQACAPEEPSEEALQNLVNTLFGPEAEEQNTSSVKDRIIFFDAYPAECDDNLLSSDYITPHPGKGLVEPKPIKMLKVCGGVTWKFPMLFPEDMSKERKAALLQLFALIFVGWGVGAKTNVGYGNLQLVSDT